jgi:Domain of unknown function (DUF309)
MLAGMPAPPEPVLTADEQKLLTLATHEFNRGAYFECHDRLEDLWSGLRGPARDFFQGLIQIAVGLYHLGNENLAGAESMFTRALRRLEPYPDTYYGFDLARWRLAIEGQRAWLHSGAPVPGPAPLPATWRFATTPYTDPTSTERS